jgi:hypothetical protein
MRKFTYPLTSLNRLPHFAASLLAIAAMKRYSSSLYFSISSSSSLWFTVHSKDNLRGNKTNSTCLVLEHKQTRRAEAAAHRANKKERHTGAVTLERLRRFWAAWDRQ